MSLLTSPIRLDPEYGQLLAAARRNFRDKPLPLLANGLSEGAAEAFLVSLIEDLCLGGATPDGKSSPHRTALMVCPEEKDCLRLRGTLERFGLKAAFYMTASDGPTQ